MHHLLYFGKRGSRVRELIPDIGLIPKVIPLKSVLYMILISPVYDVTRARASGGCFRGGHEIA